MPIGDQVQESRRRLSMVPPELRRKTVPAKLWPDGTRWCAGCQSFVMLEDVPKNGAQCRACKSAKTHASMIEKTYGLTATDYDSLLAAQGGRCAICRARPKSKRLAVDHDHKTGAVRGLLCSRCNHDLMGSAWDSMSMALALWHYMNTPPASGYWRSPELGLLAPAVIEERDDAQRPSKASEVDDGLAVPSAANARETRQSSTIGRVSLPTVEDARALSVHELNALMRYLDQQRENDPAPF